MAIKETTAKPARGNEKEFEKAKGFLNISVLLADGSTARLGSIPLRESNKLESQIAEYLKDPTKRDAGIQRLLAEKLSFGYAPTRSDDELNLDL